MDPQPQSEPIAQRFDELGLSQRWLQALERIEWTEPSEIQARMIPPALEGRDILGQARTGTGKTGAFALPILEKVTPGEGVQALILAPTRELARQVADVFNQLIGKGNLRVIQTYGGVSVRGQAKQLKQNPEIVVGTPGRVLDLLGRKILKTDTIRFAVLDEVDRMLDIGFRDDIRKILGHVQTEHQTFFVSATVEEEILRLTKKYLKDPVEIYLAPDKPTVEKVTQYYISVQKVDKTRMLVALLERETPSLSIVFTRMKRSTNKIAKALQDAGVNAREIHGDMFQRKREKIMKGFRDGKIDVLVATDLASRGLDIDDISHVINYDIPEDPAAYVHRIGRTARMGEAGWAITFVTPEQGPELTEIEKLINKQIPETTVEDFTHSEIEQEGRKAQPTKQVISRNKQSVFGKTDAAKPVRKTLGGKFKPRRGRRL